MKMSFLSKMFAAMIAALATSATMPTRASTFRITPPASGSAATFTITRSGEGTNSAETVRYRAVSRSAIAGLHFVDNSGNGVLSFGAGQISRQVQITERTAAQINDARFTYYQSGGATGSSRKYVFEVVDDGGFTLASTERTISYPSTNSVSSAAFDANSLSVSSDEITVTDAGFTQAYHAVPCESYLSSLPRDYLSASGAKLCVTVDFQAAEVSDGYQYVQIVTNTTTACDNAKSAEGGNPGTPTISPYLAGFEHKHGAKNADFKKYSFPVTSAGSNCGAVSTPWTDLGNDIGNLCQQYFRADARAADGRIALLPSISSLGIRFDASGSDNDDWIVKSVVANLQTVPAGPSLLANPVVTASPVCKGSVVTVSLAFNEIVTVSAPLSLVLNTTWGDLAYAAGSGANVLTFTGTVTAPAGTQLRLTGLSGATVAGLSGASFYLSSSPSGNRTVDSLPTPPRDAVGAYLLSTPAHLRWFADCVASYPQTSAALAADIDLSLADSFAAIGGPNGFAGTFDGRGHAISGLKVTSSDSSGASPARYGLFGQIAEQGVVTNLVLSAPAVAAPANPALVGAVCGRNLGTVAICSVSGGQLSTGPRNADGTGTALGGVCGENAGTIRACRVVGPLGSSGAILFNRVKNAAVGGIAAVNAASGTLEACYFHAGFSDVTGENITCGAVCGSNAGTIRRCAGLHDNNNYFSGAVGSDAGTVTDTTFPAASAFSSGEVCYALNNGVTDGYQPWYQSGIPLGDPLPVFSGSTVYLHGSSYENAIVHSWTLASAELTPDYSNFVWTVSCTVCGETATLTATGTAEIWGDPTCTEPGTIFWTYVAPVNAYHISGTKEAFQPAPPALGHDWLAPEYAWAADHSSCTATRTCSRCDATTNETAVAALVPELSLAATCTEPGTNTYAAAFAAPLFDPQTNAFEVAALGHAWDTPTYVWSADNSTVSASNACTRCGETVQETVAATVVGSTSPTCTKPGTVTLAGNFTSPFGSLAKTVETEPALGHDWNAPVWNWNADYTAATAAFACSRGDTNETVAAAVTRVPDGANTVCTATAEHHGETFTDTVTILPPVSYIDADGVERQCYRYTVLDRSTNFSQTYGERNAENWYVVTNKVTIGGRLHFLDAHAHLILCDGATLTASYYISAIDTLLGALTIYGQSGGTGAISATSATYAIDISGDFTVNGGIVEATTLAPDTYYGFDATGTATINGGVVRGSVRGSRGIVVNGGVVESAKLATANNAYDIVLGWTNATDSVTAAAYSAYSVSVRAEQRLWNGEEFVGDGAVDISKLAGKTLTPAYEIVCDLGGGTLETENPAYYARESDDIVLANPVRTGYDFAGWTGTGLSAPTNLVVIPRGSTGHRAYAATWERITAVPYIDENGEEQVCTNFLFLSSAPGGDCVRGTAGTTNWFVVSGRIDIGRLVFSCDRACVILRDGATLAVTNATDVADAIHAYGRLEIYGQAGGTGALVARGNLGEDDDGIEAASLGIYGGSVRAHGQYGIYVTGDLEVGGGTLVARGKNGNGIQVDGDLLVRGGAIDASVGGMERKRSSGIRVENGDLTVLGGTVVASGSGYLGSGIYAKNGDIAVRGGSVVATGHADDAIFAYEGGFTMSGGTVTATGSTAADGIYAKGGIVLGWTDLSDSILASYYGTGSGATVTVRNGQAFAAADGGLYEGELDSSTLSSARGKTLRPYIDTPAYKDPEGNVIEDRDVIEWLSANNFTQADIDVLGGDSAATDKLYECWLLNCDFTVQDAGGALSITGIAVSNGVVSVTVQLVRTAPLGVIKGVLNLYGADDLAVGFGSIPIPDESVEYFTGDPTFNLATASNDAVTQTAVATLNSSVTAKFFKVAIDVPIPDDPE